MRIRKEVTQLARGTYRWQGSQFTRLGRSAPLLGQHESKGGNPSSSMLNFAENDRGTDFSNATDYSACADFSVSGTSRGKARMRVRTPKLKNRYEHEIRKPVRRQIQSER